MLVDGMHGNAEFNCGRLRIMSVGQETKYVLLPLGQPCDAIWKFHPALISTFANGGNGA
jgi:hypothetical protein